MDVIGAGKHADYVPIKVATIHHPKHRSDKLSAEMHTCCTQLGWMSSWDTGWLGSNHVRLIRRRWVPGLPGRRPVALALRQAGRERRKGCCVNTSRPKQPGDEQAHCGSGGRAAAAPPAAQEHCAGRRCQTAMSCSPTPRAPAWSKDPRCIQICRRRRGLRRSRRRARGRSQRASSSPHRGRSTPSAHSAERVGATSQAPLVSPLQAVPSLDASMPRARAGSHLGLALPTDQLVGGEAAEAARAGRGRQDRASRQGPATCLHD